ncbi:MAG: hypothetical protein IKT38_03385 [Clostridia bacterium]|nr:hypothetical protein [Clostridia bacterium]
MRKTKKLLSILVAVVLAFSCFAAIPMTASAATSVSDLASFKKAVAAGGEINITGDFSVTEQVIIDKSVTINGGTSTITLTRDENIKFTGSGDIILNGGTWSATSGSNDSFYFNTFTGNLTFKGGVVVKGRMLSADAACNIRYEDCKFENYSKNPIEIRQNGGTVVVTKDAEIYTNKEGIYTTSACNATVTIGEEGASGPIIQAKQALPLFGKEGGSMKATIYSGTFTTTTDSGCYAIKMSGGANVTINGGTFTSNGAGYTFYPTGKSVVTVNGGTFTQNGSNKFCYNESDANTTINGGTFIQNSDNHMFWHADRTTLTINGGTFNQVGKGIIIKQENSTKFYLNGGTFINNNADFADGIVDINATAALTVVDGSSGNLSMTHAGSGPFFRFGSANTGHSFSNWTINRTEGTGNIIKHTYGNNAAVLTITNCEMTAIASPIYLPSGNNPGTLNLDGGKLVSINNVALLNEAGWTVNNNGTVLQDAGYIPPVCQIGETTYEKFADAAEAVQDGETITLLEEISSDISLDANKTYTVDASDNRIIGTINVNAGNVTLKDVTATNVKVNNAANVVIDGGSYDGATAPALIVDSAATGTITVKNGASLTCSTGNVINTYAGSNATINLEDCSVSDTAGEGFAIKGAGTINIGKEDGSVTTYVEGTSAKDGDLIWWTEAGSATVNIYDGAEIKAALPVNINGSGKPVLNIYGGTLTSNASTSYGGHVIQIQQTSTVNISGGELHAKDGTGYAVVYDKAGAADVNIEDGDFYGMVVRTAGAPTGGSVNVTGGIFNDSSSDYMFKFESAAVGYNFNGVEIIRDGNETALFYIADNITVNFAACYIVPGGGAVGIAFEGSKSAFATFDEDTQFDGDIDSEPITIITAGGDPICEINDEPYVSIEEAMAAIEDGDELKLIDNIVGVIEFNANKTYTVNGNGYEFAGIPNVSAGNVTFTDLKAVNGITVSGNAVVTVDGGIIESYANAITLASDFTGTLTLKGGAEVNALGDNALVAYISAGNQGTINFENCSLNDDAGKAINVQGAGTINFGLQDGTGAVAFNASTTTGTTVDMVHYLGEGSATVNVYSGAEFVGNKPFHAESTGNPTINIFGGTFKGNNQVPLIDFRKTATVNISDGTFDKVSGGTGLDTFAWFRTGADGSVLNITGGNFVGSAITGDGMFAMASGSYGVEINISNVTLAMTREKPIISHVCNSGSVTLNNVNIKHEGTALPLEVKNGNNKVVNITDCNFTAENTVLDFAVSSGNTMTVNFAGENVVTSNYDAEPIAKTEGVVINGLENVNTVLKYDGTPNIFRLAGKNGSGYPGVDRTISLDPNTTYTYSFNYRATAGAIAYTTVDCSGAEITQTADTGTFRSFTITTGDAESNLLIRLTNMAGKIASCGTVYYANVVLKAADSDENLIKNGDFGRGEEGWNFINNPQWECYDYGFIPYVAELFDDVALSNNNAALLLKGGERHEAQFFSVFDAGASYTFKFDYRSNTSHFIVGAYNGAVVEEISTEGFTKTYKITNPTEEAIKARVYFRLGADSYDAKLYLSNFSLIKDGDANNVNIIADLNPVFGTADNIRMSQQSDEAVTRVVGHGWLGNFQGDSDGGEVNIGSDKYTSVVSIPEDFFTVYSDAEISVNLKQILIGLAKATINPYEDANNDGEVNVKDLIRVQKRALGLLGSAAAEAALEAVIDAGIETTIEGTAYYVDAVNGNDNNNGTSEATALKTISRAISKAGSGNTILLKRGTTYRSVDEIKLNSDTTLSAYGEGARPEILGSAQDYKTKEWKNEGNNIWSVELDSTNEVGNVYFFKGDEVISGVGFTGNRSEGTVRFDSKDKLANEGEYCALSTFTFSGRKYTLYVNCANENGPAAEYDRIEVAQAPTVIGLADGVIVENITVKYSGGHGIQGSNMRGGVTVRYCEIGYVGGRKNSTGDSDPLGNGIEFGNGGSNFVASYNHIYQCYDSAITPQAWDSKDFSNVSITNNLLTNNFYGMEIWGTGNSKLENILVEGNIIANTGYCWSFDQRPLDGNIAMFSAHIYGGRNSYNTNANNSITIKNNTFSNARVNIICWFWGGVGTTEDSIKDGYADVTETNYQYLTTEGNIYYQENVNWDGYIMRYGDVDSFDYATSQQSLAEAVARFDENALLVAWID